MNFQEWLALIVQVAEFAWGAVMHFMTTPEGRKEFADVVEAFNKLADDDDQVNPLPFNEEPPKGAAGKGRK